VDANKHVIPAIHKPPLVMQHLRSWSVVTKNQWLSTCGTKAVWYHASPIGLQVACGEDAYRRDIEQLQKKDTVQVAPVASVLGTLGCRGCNGILCQTRSFLPEN